MNNSSLLSIVNSLSKPTKNGEVTEENILSAGLLLGVLTSRKRISYWAKYHRLSERELFLLCVNFIRQHILNNTTDSYLVLFVNPRIGISQVHYRRHYRLLINLFHPDKFRGNADHEQCSRLVINAYREVRQETNKQSSHIKSLSGVSNTAPDYDKESNVEITKSTSKKLVLKLRKVTVKPKKNRGVHLFLSIVFICFALFLVIYISQESSIRGSFYKKTDLLSNNRSQLEKTNINQDVQIDLSKKQ